MLTLSLELELDDNDAYKDRALQLALWFLIHQDELYLKHHPETPLLYESGVRYAREPFGYESWPNIPVVLKRKAGDCEDLVAWRVAELRQHGIPARPSWSYRELTGPQGDYRLYHIRVWIPAGYGETNARFEDPSKELGMGGVRDMPPFNYDWILKAKA